MFDAAGRRTASRLVAAGAGPAPYGTTFTYADDDQIAEARSDDWVHRFVHGPAGVLSSETITNLADGTSYEVTREWGEAGAPVGARLPAGRTVRYTPTADGEGERVALGEGVELACEYGPAGELVGIAAGAVRVRREGLLLGAAIARIEVEAAGGRRLDYEYRYDVDGRLASWSVQAGGAATRAGGAARRARPRDRGIRRWERPAPPARPRGAGRAPATPARATGPARPARARGPARP